MTNNEKTILTMVRQTKNLDEVIDKVISTIIKSKKE